MQTPRLSAKFTILKIKIGDLRDSCRSNEKIFREKYRPAHQICYNKHGTLHFYVPGKVEIGYDNSQAALSLWSINMDLKKA